MLEHHRITATQRLKKLVPNWMSISIHWSPRRE